MKKFFTSLFLLTCASSSWADSAQTSPELQTNHTINAVLIHSKHCGYCKMLMSNMEDIQRALGKKNYQLVLEKIDTSELQDPIKAAGIKQQLDKYAFQNIHLSSVPTLILVDPSFTEKQGSFGCRITGYAESQAYANEISKRAPSCSIG